MTEPPVPEAAMQAAHRAVRDQFSPADWRLLSDVVAVLAHAGLLANPGELAALRAAAAQAHDL